MKYCFGVDIGGTTVKMGLFQADGEVVAKWEIPTRKENDGEFILPDIADSIQEKMKEHQIEKEQVVGVGVGVPAAVQEESMVQATANLGWGYKEVKKELESFTGLPVKIGNDANVAALGEMWKGGGNGFKNMVMVTLGTGVGGGIILDGRILVGVHGIAGEIGHLTVNEEETEFCGCDRTGCLEQYASATGIVRLAKKKLEDCKENTILEKASVTAKDVFDAVKAGDKVAQEVAEEFGAYLAKALNTIAIIVDPDIFVIGGGVSKAGEILLDYIEKHYRKNALWATKEVKFALATLGNDAGICGAAKLVLDV